MSSRAALNSPPEVAARGGPQIVLQAASSSRSTTQPSSWKPPIMLLDLAWPSAAALRNQSRAGGAVPLAPPGPGPARWRSCTCPSPARPGPPEPIPVGGHADGLARARPSRGRGAGPACSAPWRSLFAGGVAEPLDGLAAGSQVDAPAVQQPLAVDQLRLHDARLPRRRAAWSAACSGRAGQDALQVGGQGLRRGPVDGAAVQRTGRMRCVFGLCVR
ncbi:hypothetical protein CDEN61S_03389 [Castellaniella denitrificans]